MCAAVSSARASSRTGGIVRALQPVSDALPSRHDRDRHSAPVGLSRRSSPGLDDRALQRRARRRVRARRPARSRSTTSSTSATTDRTRGRPTPTSPRSKRCSRRPTSCRRELRPVATYLYALDQHRQPRRSRRGPSRRAADAGRAARAARQAARRVARGARCRRAHRAQPGGRRARVRVAQGAPRAPSSR